MAIHIELSVGTKQLSNGPLQKTLEFLKKIKKAQDEVNERFATMADAMKSVQGSGALPSAVRRSAPSGASGGGRSQNPAPGQPGHTRMATPMDIFRLINSENNASGGKFAAQRQQALQNAMTYARAQMNAGQSVGFANMRSLIPHLTQKAQKSPGQLFADVFSTARFGSGGLQPLVGRTVKAFASLGGLGKYAGPIGIAAMVISKGVEILAQNFGEAAEYIAAKQRAMAMLGSESSSAVFGLGTDSTSAAMRVRQAVQNGGGASEAAAAGIRTVQGSYTNNDYGETLRKAMVHISKATSFDDARRRAERLGLPEGASAYYLNQGQKAALGKSAPTSVEDSRRAAQLGFEMDATAKAFHELQAEAMKPFIDAFIEIAPVVRAYVEFMKMQIAILSAPVKMFIDLWQRLVEWLRRLRIGGSAPNAHAENTKAVQENTREMKAGREYRGGGPRAAGSTPAKVGGRNWNPDAGRALGVGMNL